MCILLVDSTVEMMIIDENDNNGELSLAGSMLVNIPLNMTGIHLIFHYDEESFCEPATLIKFLVLHPSIFQATQADSAWPSLRGSVQSTGDGFGHR